MEARHCNGVEVEEGAENVVQVELSRGLVPDEKLTSPGNNLGDDTYVASRRNGLSGLPFRLASCHNARRESNKRAIDRADKHYHHWEEHLVSKLSRLVLLIPFWLGNLYQSLYDWENNPVSAQRQDERGEEQLVLGHVHSGLVRHDDGQNRTEKGKDKQTKENKQKKLETKLIKERVKQWFL
jgi:hypothetical protein